MAEDKQLKKDEKKKADCGCGCIGISDKKSREAAPAAKKKSE